MGKGRDRGPRRRGFDDDMFSPRDFHDERPAARPPYGGGPPARQPQGEGPTIDATVKWFNGEKGFGFAELGDGTGDAFLHIAVLQAAGQDAVEPGTKLRVQVGQGQKGRQITAVLEVDRTTAAAPQPRRAPSGGGGGGRGFQPDESSAVEIDGTVKWFNGEKGFGFVVTEDGGKDVFVHISVLEKAGLRSLAEGQRISMRVVQTAKGREAISVTPS
jgi:CspA family cold shock protein